MKTIQDFEEFMEDEFAIGEGIAVLDDDLTDAFEKWYCELDHEQLTSYFDEYLKIVTK